MKQQSKRLFLTIGRSLFLSIASVFLVLFLMIKLILPDTIRVMDGQSWGYGFLQLEPQESQFVTVNETAIRQNVQIEGTDRAATQAEVKLWGWLPLKAVSLEVWQEKSLLIGGHTIGIDLYTDGVLVLGLGTVETASGEEMSPARGILYSGDRIHRVNGQEVTTVEQVNELIGQSGFQPVRFDLMRDGENMQVSVTPKKDIGGSPRIGIWIRDRAQGLGTLTFVDPVSQRFGSVGHGISDVDTGELLPIQEGVITRAKIRNLVKGEKGMPGEVEGSLTGSIWGQVRLNSEFGIYGHYVGEEGTSGEYWIVLKDQVQNGEAVILSDILDGVVREYTVQIEKASGLPAFNNGLVVTVTDERLLERTGGIIQGMSGCPLVQNGKLIGAITHVFIKDPTKGYGIYIEDMLSVAENMQN